MKDARSRLGTLAITALIAVGLGALSGCGENTTEPGSAGSVTLLFNHRVGGDPLNFDTVSYTNAAGNVYTVETLRYYVSDFVLHRPNGSAFLMEGQHYRDAADNATRSTKLESVPGGSYTAVSFTFGLDDRVNVTGGLPNDQTNNNMEWPEPLGGGYHYMKFEGFYSDSAGDPVSFRSHMGVSLIDSVKVHHDIYVTLSDIVIDIDDNGWQVEILMDLNEWFDGPHQLDFNAFFAEGAGIMDNPAAQDTLMQNGSTVFSVGEIKEVEE